VRLPIAIDLYPGSAADAERIVSSGLHMTVRLESDLLNTSLRQTGTIHKAVAAAHSPFEKTIVMDTDTCVMHDSLQEMLAPLDDDFDFVSTWECCAVSRNSSRQPTWGTGWEPQTGVFAIRRSTAKALCFAWYDEFVSQQSYYEQLTSTDQQALLTVFRTKPIFRYLPFPSSFNFRPGTMPVSRTSTLGRKRFDKGVVVIHQHSTLLSISPDLVVTRIILDFLFRSTTMWSALLLFGLLACLLAGRAAKRLGKA